MPPIIGDYATSDKEASLYFKARKRYARKYNHFLVSALKLNKNSVVADVACGPGTFSRFIKPMIKNGKLYMIDLNPHMLHEAKKHAHGKNVFVIKGRADNIDRLINQKIDSIIATNAFDLYVGNQKRFLRASNNVLRKGGILIFDVVSQGIIDKRASIINNSLVKNLKVLIRTKYPGHKLNINSRYSAAETLRRYAKLIKQSGFNLKIIIKKEPWHVKREEKMLLKFPVRTKSWMLTLPYAKRKKIIMEAFNRSMDDTGISHYYKERYWFIATKK